ncbi:hypothetical protein [Chryseobacterium sp. PMSZPI]|uniref:hypothetical protein n=1 Tax=Chryseobacterium sp. PMSZPI TaxID=1033900 RepID=UPI000C345826|nr:hypothetical protein [Chryseobacterium sp. PMSZPI]PKF74011.1 hypothetical protein CW752_11430 [Chryseobacterium sp. PMSZPI]
MKKRSIILLFFLSCCQYYLAQTNLVGKSFRAVIGSVCEETTKPDPCAGYMIYLVLDFQKNHVNITEKNVRSCKEFIKYQINATWKLNSNGEIIFSYSSPPSKESFLHGFRLQQKGNTLLGYRKDWQDEMIEYTFEKVQ